MEKIYVYVLEEHGYEKFCNTDSPWGVTRRAFGSPERAEAYMEMYAEPVRRVTPTGGEIARWEIVDGGSYRYFSLKAVPFEN